MATTVFAGCGSGDSQDSSAGTSGESSSEESATDESGEETASAEPDTTYGTSQEGKFVVGFDQEFPPMGFVGEDGEYTGFDLALAEEVASRLDLEFVPSPSAGCQGYGTVLRYHRLYLERFYHQRQEEDYTFSDPYLDNRQVFVVNSDSDIQSSADLAGKIVEVQADSSAEAALNDNTELSGTFGTMQTVPDYNTAMMDLEQGAVDAIAMDEVVAAYQIQNRENQFRILDEEISSEEYAIGFLKGNES